VSDFKAKMHQIRLQRSTITLAAFNGPTSNSKEGNGRGKERRGRKGKGEGRGEEVEGGIWPTQKFWRGASYVSRCMISHINPDNVVLIEKVITMQREHNVSHIITSM